MDRMGMAEILAGVVALWFLATGLAELRARPVAAGRRAVAAEPGRYGILRRARGVLSMLGGLGVAAAAATAVLRIDVPIPERGLGLGLAALALWRAGEQVRPPVRWMGVIVAATGFFLATFYAGFRA